MVFVHILPAGDHISLELSEHLVREDRDDQADIGMAAERATK